MKSPERWIDWKTCRIHCLPGEGREELNLENFCVFFWRFFTRLKSLADSGEPPKDWQRLDVMTSIVRDMTDVFYREQGIAQTLAALREAAPPQFREMALGWQAGTLDQIKQAA